MDEVREIIEEMKKACRLLNNYTIQQDGFYEIIADSICKLEALSNKDSKKEKQYTGQWYGKQSHER